MIDSDNVGLISGGIGPADCDFCERTLLILDGEKRININIPELPQDDDLHRSEVAELTQIFVIPKRCCLKPENELRLMDNLYKKHLHINGGMQVLFGMTDISMLCGKSPPAEVIGAKKRGEDRTAQSELNCFLPAQLSLVGWRHGGAKRERKIGVLPLFVSGHLSDSRL